MIPIQTKNPVLLFIILLFAINWTFLRTPQRNFRELTHDCYVSNVCTELEIISKLETNTPSLIN